MTGRERAERERKLAVAAHRRAAKVRRWSLRELRLDAALRYAREAEALEQEALGHLGAGRRFERTAGESRPGPASLDYDI